MKSETEILEEQSDEETELPDDGAILVTAIKTGARKLREELDKYKYLIMNLRKIQRLKETASLANLDFIIDYYEEILEKIILAYQSAWKINGGKKSNSSLTHKLLKSFRSADNAKRGLPNLLSPTVVSKSHKRYTEIVSTGTNNNQNDIKSTRKLYFTPPHSR